MEYVGIYVDLYVSSMERDEARRKVKIKKRRIHGLDGAR